MNRTLKCIYTFSIVFLFSVGLPLYLKASPNQFSGSFKVENEYTMAWSGDSEQITFTIQAKTKGWVALGFQPTFRMKDADILIAYFDGTLKQGVMKDCFSVGEMGPHPEDITLGGQNNFENFSISENDEYTIVQFSRRLQTNDQFDAVIDPAQNMKIMWATGAEDNTDLIHAKKGFVNINWSQNSASTGIPIGQRGKPIHFILMSIGLFLLAIGIWLVKKKISYTKKLMIHAVIVSLGSLLLLIGFSLQFLWLQITGRSHFTVFHTWAGLGSLFSLLASFLLAWLFFRKKSPNKRNTHISLGVASAVLALIAAITGKFLILNLF